MSNEVEFNPLDPRIVADPFPFYKPLMQGPPKQVFLGQPTTLVARYDHVVKVLKDFDNFKNEIPQDEVNAALDVFGGAKVIPFADEPDHAPLAQTGPAHFFAAERPHLHRPKPRKSLTPSSRTSAKRKKSTSLLTSPIWSRCT